MGANVELRIKNVEFNCFYGRVEYIQLSLFDCTYDGTRYENPTRF